jgi:hypothetical protein
VHNHFGPPRESPTEPLSEIVRRVGRASDRRCESYGPSHAGRELLVDHLLAGLERKTTLALELMGARDWDLFCWTLTQCHCVGHELWGYAPSTARSTDLSAGSSNPPGRPADWMRHRRADRRDHWWTWADRAGKRAVVLDAIEGGLNSQLDGREITPRTRDCGFGGRRTRRPSTGESRPASRPRR